MPRPENTVAAISSLLRGWCGYFNQGPVIRLYKLVRWYTQIDGSADGWCDAADNEAPGTASIPDEYLYETLGLYRIAAPSRRPAESEGLMTGESRMREICTSGLTSGDWKRSHGPNQ